MKKSNKLTSLLNVIVGGYQQVSKKTLNETNDLYTKFQSSSINQSAFLMLLNQETVAIPARIKDWTDLVNEQKTKEKALQSRYADLLREADTLNTLLTSS
jgi:hypothetical protein